MVPSGSLLMLADGRLPTGGYAHSGGVEAAVADGRVSDTTSLGDYLAGRLATAGEVDAGLAVAAWRWASQRPGPEADPGVAIRLDAEAAARSPSPALRRASRAQGRGLRRVALRCWPSPALDCLGGVHVEGPMWPLALGAAAASAGEGPSGAALLARWAVLTGPAWAATRLLGLDPLEVAALLAGLAGTLEAASPSALPALGGPLVELAAEVHAGWEVRLFAS
jgi:urease accessory protein